MKIILTMLALTLGLVCSTEAGQQYYKGTSAGETRISASKENIAREQNRLVRSLMPKYSNDPKQERLNQQTRRVLRMHMKNINNRKKPHGKNH